MEKTKTQTVECKTLKDLRIWLDKNHTQNESVWLVYYKPTAGVGDITYTNLVDELLCYGWIDSLPRKVDATRTSIRISPRNPKSNWSRVNKQKIATLTKTGKMKPAGLELVAQAKKSGTWDALNDVENLVIPADLVTALKTVGLQSEWEAASRTKKRGWLEQLFNAKSPETRQKRINSFIVELKK